MFTFQTLEETESREPWNKGKLVGQRRPLKLKEIWNIRIRFQMNNSVRDLALFNLAIDRKLRGCDLVRLRVSDVTHSGRMMSRANVIQRKTGSWFSLRLRRKLKNQFLPGLRKPGSTPVTICFQAEFAHPSTYQHGSTRE